MSLSSEKRCYNFAFESSEYYLLPSFWCLLESVIFTVEKECVLCKYLLDTFTCLKMLIFLHIKASFAG